MNPAIVYGQVSNDKEIQQILDLQAQNLSAVLSPEVIASQEFLTVRHDPAILQRMNQAG
jgi:hypothetical protein